MIRRTSSSLSSLSLSPATRRSVVRRSLREMTPSPSTSYTRNATACGQRVFMHWCNGFHESLQRRLVYVYVEGEWKHFQVSQSRCKRIHHRQCLSLYCADTMTCFETPRTFPSPRFVAIFRGCSHHLDCLLELWPRDFAVTCPHAHTFMNTYVSAQMEVIPPARCHSR